MATTLIHLNLNWIYLICTSCFYFLYVTKTKKIAGLFILWPVLIWSYSRLHSLCHVQWTWNMLVSVFLEYYDTGHNSLLEMFFYFGFHDFIFCFPFLLFQSFYFAFSFPSIKFLGSLGFILDSFRFLSRHSHGKLHIPRWFSSLCLTSLLSIPLYPAASDSFYFIYYF